MTSPKTVVHSIDFRAPPPAGTILMFEGQKYEAIGRKLHTRSDGLTVPMIVWRTHCPTCGVSFEVISLFRARWINRRCELHKQPGLPVGSKGRGLIAHRSKGETRRSISR